MQLSSLSPANLATISNLKASKFASKSTPTNVYNFVQAREMLHKNHVSSCNTGIRIDEERNGMKAISDLVTKKVCTDP